MVMHDKKMTMAKNTPPSLVISMVVAMFRCDTACIARYGRSQGYPFSGLYWTWPSGKYSPRIAPADAMVINVGVKIEL
jgi:hypothetical protein